MADNALVPWADVQQMAQVVVRSQLFPSIKTEQAAMTLMLLCQAEGLHPIQALRRYDIIQGRPALKADAMLADFMKHGGKVNWVQLTNEVVEADFHAPGLTGPVRIRWGTEEARTAGLLDKENWRRYPRAMRRARVISEGVRTAMPAVNTGIHTPEEVRDFDEPTIEAADVVAIETAPAVPATEPEPDFQGRPIPGHCTVKGCPGDVLLYKSTSKRFPGREYAMCEAAYNLKQELLDAGSSNREANGQVSKHYREWTEPWPRTASNPPASGATDGPAPGADT